MNTKLIEFLRRDSYLYLDKYNFELNDLLEAYNILKAIKSKDVKLENKRISGLYLLERLILDKGYKL